MLETSFPAGTDLDRVQWPASLTHLTLHTAGVQHFDVPALARLEHLQTLHFIDMSLISFSTEHVPRITSLDIGSDSVRSLADLDLSAVRQSVQTLHFHFHGMQDDGLLAAKDVFGGMCALRKLSMCLPRVTELPSDFFVALRHLQHLELNVPNLSKLPSNFRKLTNLQQLRIHGSKDRDTELNLCFDASPAPQHLERLALRGVRVRRLDLSQHHKLRTVDVSDAASCRCCSSH